MSSILNSIILYFPSSFAESSGVATLYLPGTNNQISGVMPMFLLAKERKNSNLSLFLRADSQTSFWSSLSDYWESYNISCDSGATYFCQNWENIPYSLSGASGINKYLTMAISGSYRSKRNYQMPLFMICTGGGVINNNINMFLYSENIETKASGNSTLFSIGHGLINDSATLFTSGVMPDSSGSMTLFCDSYDSIESTIKLFTSGI